MVYAIFLGHFCWGLVYSPERPILDDSHVLPTPGRVGLAWSLSSGWSSWSSSVGLQAAPGRGRPQAAERAAPGSLGCVLGGSCRRLVFAGVCPTPAFAPDPRGQLRI